MLIFIVYKVGYFMRNSLSKQILLSIFGLAILVLAIVGVSYAVMVSSYKDSKLNIIRDGRVSMSFSKPSNQLLLSKQFVMRDDEAMQLDEGDNVFDFNVSSLLNGNSKVSYQIVLTKLDIKGNELDSNCVRLCLEKLVDGRYVSVMPNTIFQTSSLNNMILYFGSFQNDDDWKRNFTDSYRLRVWVNEEEHFIGADQKIQFEVKVYDYNL